MLSKSLKYINDLNQDRFIRRKSSYKIFNWWAKSAAILS